MQTERTILVQDLTDEWIGWQIRPLRDEFVKGPGGLGGMLITHGPTFVLHSVDCFKYNTGPRQYKLTGEGHRLFSRIYSYPADTVVELLGPWTAKAKKGAKDLGYDNRKHRWIDT